MATSYPVRVRLFFALGLPAVARAEIASWRDPFVCDLRPVATDSLHVTLVFLGWREEEQAASAAAVAEAAVAGRRAVSLAPTGLRAVPPRSPRLLALELEDRGGRCEALHASLSSALYEAGLHPLDEAVLEPHSGAQSQPRRQTRPFWAHVTLARAQRGRRAKSSEPDRLPSPFVADRVALFRSILRPQGALYEPLWTATLDP